MNNLIDQSKIPDALKQNIEALKATFKEGFMQKKNLDSNTNLKNLDQKRLDFMAQYAQIFLFKFFFNI